MLRSLYSGISGMKNMQTKLDVIGNNIANVNTHGFKKGRVTFKDAISQTISTASGPSATLGGKNAQQVGLGVETASIDTVFTEGSLQTTGRVLDLAVTGGDGYFVVRNGSNNYYTRAGNFYLDEQGYLVNSDGNFVLAYDSFDNTLSNIQIPKNILSNTFSLIGNLNRDNIATGSSGITYNQIITDNNLNEHRINFEFEPTGTATVWDVTLFETETGNELGSFSVEFDETTGKLKNYIINGAKMNSASLTLQLDNGRGGIAEAVLDLDFSHVTSVNNSDNITVVGEGSNKIELDGSLLEGTTPTNPITVSIRDGEVVGTATITFGNSVRDNATTSWEVQGLGDPITLVFDNLTGNLISINGSNQNLDNYTLTADVVDTAGNNVSATFRIDFTGLVSASDYEFIFEPAVAELQEYSISGTGDFIAQYSDGSVRTIATLALARFNNAEGLTKVGGNLYSASENSGVPMFGNAGGGFGNIESGKLEMSNVDLTEEFTEMIVAQRAFQSNSRIITTSDEILQEIVNLKR